MPRIDPLPNERASERATLLLDRVQRTLGMTPNLMRTLAHSPAVLEAYQAFNAALGGGDLSAALREQIALTVSESNRCAYCLAAHTAIAKAHGLSEDVIRDARRGTSCNSKDDAALTFVRALIEKRGLVSDADLDRVRAAGYSDSEILEVTAVVHITSFTNYVHHVAETDIDFPTAAPLNEEIDHATTR